MIKLGYLEGDSPNEHLCKCHSVSFIRGTLTDIIIHKDWDLASGFPLNKGAQSVTLPSDLETKKTYIIVLMGDSGNASPKFLIQAARS